MEGPKLFARPRVECANLSLDVVMETTVMPSFIAMPIMTTSPATIGVE